MMTSSKHQIFQRTKSIFRKIVLGKLKLTPEHYTEKPILPGNAQNWQRPSPPQIDAVMIERLRTMLSRAGLNPVSDGGLPPLPKPRFNEPLNNTYTDACREFKYEFVRSQMAAMPKIVEELKKKKREEKATLKAKKLPY